VTRSRALGALVAGLLLTTACASWEETRTEVVDPVNQLLHRRYPQAFKAQDVAAIASMCAPAVRASVVADAREWLDRFERVDRSLCLIDDATPVDGDWVVESDCTLRLDGQTPDGEYVTVEQTREITVKRGGDGEWKITAWGPSGEQFVVRSSEVPSFRSEADLRGLSFQNRSRGVVNRLGVPGIYHAGSGMALGDVDGDGLDDVFLVGGGDLRLFLNTGGEFEDVTEAWGVVTPPEGECRSAVFGDYDDDGDADLWVAILNNENVLFENQGDRFERVPEAESGLSSTGQAICAAFADFDADGDLDLFVANGLDLFAKDPDPVYNAKNAVPNQYFRNRGDGTFEEVTDEVGLGDSGWALGCAISDYDLDGDVDLFVANDFGPDLLWRNEGDGTFEDVTSEAGVDLRGSAMSADWGDVNGDGYPDLYVSGMASNSRWMIRQPGFPIPLSPPFDELLRGFVTEIMWEMFHGNRLYLSQGDGTFREASTKTRTNFLHWAWAAVFFDVDHDGWQDIYGVNGFWSGDEPDDL